MNTFTLSIVLVTAIFVSLFKTVIELRVKPGSALHDTIIRLIAILVGIVLSFGDYLINTPSWQHGPELESTLGRGLVAGIGAIVTFHLVTAGSSVWDTLTPGDSTVSTTTTGTALAPVAVTKQTTITQTQEPAIVTVASVPAVEPVQPLLPPLPDTPLGGA